MPTIKNFHQTQANDYSKMRSELSQSQDVEVESFFTSAEVMNKWASNLKIEVIASVSNIQACRRVFSQNGENVGMFSCRLHGQDNSHVQLVAWEDNAERFNALKLSSGNIVRIEDVCVNPVKLEDQEEKFPLQLIAKPSTKVTVLKATSPTIEEVQAVIPCIKKFEQIAEHEGLIKIDGFIRSNFAVIQRDLGEGPDFICGAITDGWQKLEVRIVAPTMPETDFQKGAHVQVVGELKKQANPVYLAVRNISDVTLVDEEMMPFSRLIGAWRYIKSAQ